MAKAAAKPKKEITMEEALWKSADKLRGSVEPAEYKHVVLSLFFLKFASDKFEAQRKTIAEKFGEKFIDNVDFYTKDNVFFLPEESRWSYIIEHAKQDDIALKIDTALYNIEKANPALKGALPDNYYSRLHIDTAKLASLLDEINRINTDDAENDIMIDFSNPQIDRHIIRKFVSKIVPNGRNHFRWYMNLDGKDTTTLDMVTEGRKNNAVISFNDDEEDEPPLHIGDVIGLTELQQYFPNLLKNENQNGIITTVGKCGKKSSLDAILHRLLSKKANNC